MLFSNLREARKAAGITQHELAAALRVNRATISKYENGSLDLPIAQAKVIARILGVRWYELYPDEQQGLVATVDQINQAETRNALFADERKVLKYRLNKAFSHLNEKGQQVAVERVEELTKIPDYQRTDAPSDTP